jgi:hypothetical protein
MLLPFGPEVVASSVLVDREEPYRMSPARRYRMTTPMAEGVLSINSGAAGNDPAPRADCRCRAGPEGLQAILVDRSPDHGLQEPAAAVDLNLAAPRILERGHGCQHVALKSVELFHSTVFSVVRPRTWGRDWRSGPRPELGRCRSGGRRAPAPAKTRAGCASSFSSCLLHLPTGRATR